MSPYRPLYPDTTVLMSPQLFGAVGYYRAMAMYGHTAIDYYMRYDKRFKSIHRFDIVDKGGLRTLTIPVSKPDGAYTWNKVVVSAHDRWWIAMRNALDTAYSRTPYYEFYIDRFAPLMSAEVVGMPVTELCARGDCLIREILHMPPLCDDIVGEVYDMRGNKEWKNPPYRQLNQREQGFIAGASILDATFNMGPETVLYMAECTQ